MSRVGEMAGDMLAESRLFGDPATPFKGKAFAGSSRLLVIGGENASGKSLLFQCLASWASTHYDTKSVWISIRERTGAGDFEMSGFRRSMMFGDESEQSTGATSVSVVVRGFRNVEDGKRILMLDEPEIGLSDGYCRAMGRFIAGKALALPETSPGVVVVTHHRGLVREMCEVLGESPAFVHMVPADDGSHHVDSLEGWLSGAEVRTVDDLLALTEKGNERRRQVWNFKEKLKEARLAEESESPAPAGQ